jgi:hypothetical protein
MRTKAPVKKKNGKRLPQKIIMAGPKPICLHRRSACEFSCGIRRSARISSRGIVG